MADTTTEDIVQRFIAKKGAIHTFDTKTGHTLDRRQAIDTGDDTQVIWIWALKTMEGFPDLEEWVFDLQAEGLPTRD